MSRPRTRPTREDTRKRLFAAAADVFDEHGIGAATVEQIVAAAGFTRGAFYSNFSSKDELLIAMLADHVERSTRHNLDLLVRYPDPVAFVEAMAAEGPAADDPLGASPMLQIELIVHVARTPELRPFLADRLRTLRTLIGQIAVTTLTAAGFDRPIDAEQTGALLLAIEDGFRLHRLIDPASTPADAYLTAVRGLQNLVLGR